MQCIYRDKLLHLKHQRLQRQYRAAQLLQAIWRGISVRRAYGHILVAKRIDRIEGMKNESLKKYQSAVNIQAYWRGFKVRCFYGPVLSSLKKERLFKALKLKEEQNKLLNKMATLIQALWRGYLVRKRYQSMLMKRKIEWQLERNSERQISATSIQAYWRGFSCRQKTKKWLLEQKMQKGMFEEQARATQAHVMNSHLSFPSSGILNSLQSTLGNEKLESLQQASGVSTIEDDKDFVSLSGASESGKLTVARRIQSALIMKSLSASDSRNVSSSGTDFKGKPRSQINELHVDHNRCDGLNMTISECEDISLVNCKMTQNSNCPLTFSRAQEDARHQCKVEMSRAMTFCHAKKVIRKV